MTKKNALLIIIGGAVLIALTAAAVLINIFIGTPAENQITTDTNVAPSYERDGIEIYSVNPYYYTGLRVANSFGEYTVLKNDSAYYFEGRENVPLLSASSKALYECVLSLKNESTITMKGERLSDYGLEEPQATLTVLKSQGSEDRLYLGEKTPDGGGYYFMLEGDSAVYVVSTYFGDRVIKPRTDFYITDISINFDTANLQGLAIERDTAFELQLRYGTAAEIASGEFESTMVLDKPFVVGANNENARTAVEALSHLDASRVVSDEVTEQLLAEYGLDKPTRVTVDATVDISQSAAGSYTNELYDPTVTEQTYVNVRSEYLVGSTVENEIFVMYNDRSVIYAVDRSVFAFLDKEIDYFCQSLVTLKALKDLSRVTLSFEGRTYAISTRTETDSNNNTVYKASYQNASREGSDMQALYKLIVGVVQYGIAQSPETEPMLTITLTGNDLSTQTVEFLPYEGGLYAFCRTDGSGTFRVLTSQLEKIMEATIQFVNGDTVTVE